MDKRFPQLLIELLESLAVGLTPADRVRLLDELLVYIDTVEEGVNLAAAKEELVVQWSGSMSGDNFGNYLGLFTNISIKSADNRAVLRAGLKELKDKAER